MLAAPLRSGWRGETALGRAGGRNRFAPYCRIGHDDLLQDHAACGERLMELSEDDVLEILKLFEQSTFDFLHLQHGERKITVSKAGFAVTGAAAATVAAAPPAPPPTPAPAAPAGAPVPTAAAAVPDGLVAVTAPMVGKFYAAPSPAEPPYVQVGTRVAAGATVGLIEVMKVFTSIKTETAGTIERTMVKNGEFVEFGQVLFLLRPE
jgi:acetyl-CoA carboxylase biotin carboxyl carrier protein